MNVPWLNIIEIDLDDNIKVDFEVVDLPLEVVANEFFLGGVESEAGRDARLHVHLLLRSKERERDRNKCFK